MNVVSLGCRNAPYSASPRKESLINVPPLLPGAPSSLHQFILSNAPVVDRWQKGPHFSPPVCIPLTMSLGNSSHQEVGLLPTPWIWAALVFYFGPKNVAEWGLGLESSDTLLLALLEPCHHHQLKARLARWEDEGPRGEGSAWPSQRPGSLQTGEQVQLGRARPEEPTMLSHSRLVNSINGSVLSR